MCSRVIACSQYLRIFLASFEISISQTSSGLEKGENEARDLRKMCHPLPCLDICINSDRDPEKSTGSFVSFPGIASTFFIKAYWI